MTFLNPLLLLGLAAAAIPVIVHLFNLRRPRRVDFSSLAFVKALEKRSMRRVRIKEWLLLALRVLAVVCLVVAFARPTLTGRPGGALAERAASSVVVVVDNSLSMGRRDGQGAYLAQAQTAARGLLDELREGDQVYVLAATDTVLAAPYGSLDAARGAVAALEAGPGAAPASELVVRAGEALRASVHPNRTVYLVSDLQASTLGDSLLGETAGDVPVRLVPVGKRAHPNVAVTDARVVSRIIEPGQPVQLAATLRNYGSATVQGYVASVYLEGERVAQATTDLAPGAVVTVSFTATPPQRGWLAGRVQAEEDAFPADDVRHFALHVPRERRLLVVEGEGQEATYLETALDRQLAASQMALDVETLPESRLAGTTLTDYDAVVLAGPRTLASGEREALARYVEEGGGVLLFPGEEAAAGDYNQLLDRWGGGRFEGFSGTLGAEQAVASFDRVDREHPLFEGVFDDEGARGEVERPDVYYAADYVPRSGREQTLIGLTTGRPFLQELRPGRGRVLVAAAAPSPTWSDLPLRGLFVPLLYRSAYYLASGAPEAADRLVAGRGGTVRLPGATSEAPVRLVGPEGEEVVPEQERLFGAVLLEVGRGLRTPGVYDIRQDERLLRRVALNADPLESDLTALAPEEAAQLLAARTGHDVRVLDAGPGGTRVAEALQAEQLGVEIWNVFVWLALGFLVAETIVARQWKPEAVAAS